MPGLKLDEIQQSDKLFKPGMTVVDLGGCSGWLVKYVVTQNWRQRPHHRLRSFTYGSYRWCGLSSGAIFRDELVMKALRSGVGDSKVQVVMSDMGTKHERNTGGGYPPCHVSGGTGARNVS
ncbi:cell division protein [Escherichia coli]|uniref:Cell division protein n=1 Tax=Escherichia coli TaxID=562 RepID=A0A377BYF2_ECOLX|nr:cell division protein [Escherichia coli]